MLRCRKRHKGKKDVICTGQYSTHFVCPLLPDAGLPFCRMLPDASPDPCRMRPDAQKNLAGCSGEKSCRGSVLFSCCSCAFEFHIEF